MYKYTFSFALHTHPPASAKIISPMSCLFFFKFSDFILFWFVRLRFFSVFHYNFFTLSFSLWMFIFKFSFRFLSVFFLSFSPLSRLYIVFGITFAHHAVSLSLYRPCRSRQHSFFTALERGKIKKIRPRKERREKIHSVFKKIYTQICRRGRKFIRIKIIGSVWIQSGFAKRAKNWPHLA